MVYTDKIHLVADTIEELHKFAASIGLKRCWFHGTRKHHPHYDLHGNMHDRAMVAGAKEVTSKQIMMVFILQRQ